MELIKAADKDDVQRDGVFPLQRIVTTADPVADPVNGWVIQTSASPVGAGAILRLGSDIKEYLHHSWAAEDLPASLNIVVGESSCQSFFELLTIALALNHWGSRFVSAHCTVIGDNTGSLQNVLDQSGSRLQLAVAKELAWRRARRQWQFAVAHLPSEANVLPVTLSR